VQLKPARVPCGFYGDPTRECRCTPATIQRYLGKISGPSLDRIDIHIEVPAVHYKELRSETNSGSSESMRERVSATRDIQSKRGFTDASLPAANNN
jgi:magnesium chelatase family protein